MLIVHCVEEYPKTVYTVGDRDWDQDVKDIDEQEFSFQSVHFHPELMLVPTFTMTLLSSVTRRLAPAKPGMECTISGWESLGPGSGGYPGDYKENPQIYHSE